MILKRTISGSDPGQLAQAKSQAKRHRHCLHDATWVMVHHVDESSMCPCFTTLCMYTRADETPPRVVALRNKTKNQGECYPLRSHGNVVWLGQHRQFWRRREEKRRQRGKALVDGTLAELWWGTKGCGPRTSQIFPAAPIGLCFRKPTIGRMKVPRNAAVS